MNDPRFEETMIWDTVARRKDWNTLKKWWRNSLDFADIEISQTILAKSAAPAPQKIKKLKKTESRPKKRKETISILFTKEKIFDVPRKKEVPTW